MDMDIPLPEELELLESTYHLHEQEDLDHQDSYYPPDLEPQPEQPQPPPHDPASPSNSHKRSRSPSRSLSDSDCSDEEKREKVRVRVEDPPPDEDWLRYSPPPPPPFPSVPVEEVMFSKEKVLSRYASEIDGECMPVTAPNGDRVYSKLDRFRGEEPATKLDCSRGYSSGTTISHA